MKTMSNSLRYSPGSLAVILLGGLWACLTPAAAQTPAIPPESDPPPATAQDSPSVSQLQSRLRQIERQINELYGSLPVGLPEKQKAFFQQIDELSAESQRLEQELQAAALASLNAAGAVDPLAARLVFSQIVAKLDPPDGQTSFDPRGALELVDRWLAVENPQNMPVPLAAVAYQGFRASFALLELDRAAEMLQAIEATGVQLQPAISQELEATRQKWEREQRLREAEAERDDLPRIELVTSEGTILIELFEDQAPETVGNFVSLVEQKFYDSLEFFVVKPGEYARVGCPRNDGSTVPDYRITDEWDRADRRDHLTGTLTMFNEGAGTAATQFLITHQPNSRLDGRYTAFGRVVEGMEVVYRLQTIDRTDAGAKASEASRIESARVVRKRDHQYEPTRLALGTDNQ